MIHGTYALKRVIETSMCVLCEDSRLEKHKSYKVYSSALLPEVKSGSPKTSSDEIDKTIIKSSAKVPASIKSQNYVTAVYVGSDPPAKEKDKYEADPSYKTKKGTKFILTCLNGDPNNRTFDEMH